MTVDLIDGVLLLAPGFLALKLFYLFGAQRPRSQWEWTTWSVIASLPIVAVAAALYQFLGGVPATKNPPALEIALRLAVAASFALAASWAWRRIRRSEHRVARMVVDAVAFSAWDQALEEAVWADRLVVLILDDDGKEYRGFIRYGGREDNGADPWIYLIHPEVLEGEKFRPANATHGILVHRDQIRRIRVLEARRRAEPAEERDPRW